MGYRVPHIFFGSKIPGVTSLKTKKIQFFYILKLKTSNNNNNKMAYFLKKALGKYLESVCSNGFIVGPLTVTHERKSIFRCGLFEMW